jgi:hypothetical protein
MDKTRGYQASIDYLMPIVTNPVMTGEYCRHLRNGIDAMIKFERIQSELERLNAENAKLRAVVDAAREFISSTGCNPKECGKCDPKYIGFCRWSGIGQALAELDKEGGE